MVVTVRQIWGWQGEQPPQRAGDVDVAHIAPFLPSRASVVVKVGVVCKTTMGISMQGGP